MAKQKYKKNHWVPQSYLRSFGADAERKKIWRFGKSAGEPEQKPIEKVAVKFYLYADSKDGERDYTLEKKLSDLEQLFGDRFWLQISEDYVDLEDETIRKGVALLAAVMYLRNPTMLETTKGFHEKMRADFESYDDLPDVLVIGDKEYKVDKDSWPACRDATEDDVKRIWFKSLNEAAWLADIFLQMRWAIVASEEPVFITSDHPVTALHPSMKFQGFKNPETSVRFPLSPTRVLHLDNRHNEPDAQYYGFRGNGGAQNLITWSNAIEYMFSHRDPIDVIEEMAVDAGYQGRSS